jgi:hypothetical protein
MTVRAKVTLRLPELRQPMPLPTTSLLARIGTLEDGRPHLLGVDIDVPDRVTLRPEDYETTAEADFWYDEAAQYVKPEAKYHLWYGGDVGSITIEELL